MIAFNSCEDNNSEKFEQEIVNTDKSFSNYSEKHGQFAAFLKYAAPEVVLLKPSLYPFVGHEKLAQYYTCKSDSSYVLTWEPKFAKVAASGELGYTYGYWKFSLKSDSQKVERGTYVTIWQRQSSGDWKFVLDTGNPGLGE